MAPIVGAEERRTVVGAVGGGRPVLADGHDRHYLPAKALGDADATGRLPPVQHLPAQGHAISAMTEDTFALAVEAAPDPSGEPLPRRFRLGARVVEVADILDRWPGADHLYVKLRGTDGATYILRRHADGDWRLVLFRDPRAADPNG